MKISRFGCSFMSDGQNGRLLFLHHRLAFLCSCCLFGCRGFLLGRCRLLCRRRALGRRSHRRCVVLQSLGQELCLNVVDACCIAGVIAQEFSRGRTRAGRHTLPECHSHIGIVASHGSENQSHTVGFSLVVARVLQVAELQSVLCHHLSYRLRVLSHAQGASDGTSNLQAILLLDLLRHLFGRVGSSCVTGSNPS